MNIKKILEGVHVRTAEEFLDDYIRRTSGPYIVSVESDCIVLGNISCTGSDGKVFEHHDKLRVDKDIFRDDKGAQISKTPYEHIVYAESKGLFVPCFALSCNIIDCFHDNKHEEEIMKALMQYKDEGNGTGWHSQNTIIPKGKIIHYPLDSDFPKDYRGSNINQKRTRKTFSFTLDKDAQNSSMEDALKNTNTTNYIKDLTGMQHPEKLIEIGEHFGKTAWFWPPNPSRICAGWLGCDDGSFYVDSSYYLGSIGAASGVQNI